jgi:putative ABC transport system substrate-binding protein
LRLRRRHILASFGTTLLGGPIALFAQQPPKIRRVGVLSHGTRPDQPDTSVVGAFIRGMRELGYIEGKNLIIEWRFADGKMERLPDLATELVGAKSEVIVSFSTATTHALQKATTMIPIVMAVVADPIGSGFVNSLARPGGNITGLSNIVFELRGKQLEMLRTVRPKLARVAALLNPEVSTNIDGFKIFETAAAKLGIRAVSLDARTPQQIEKAFALMAKESIQAILVIVDPIVFLHRRQIAESAMKLNLPSIASDQRGY